jgi:hypothetical protein
MFQYITIGPTTCHKTVGRSVFWHSDTKHILTLQVSLIFIIWTLSLYTAFPSHMHLTNFCWICAQLQVILNELKLQQTVRTFEMNSSQRYLQFLHVTLPVILSYIHYITISLNMHTTDNGDLFSENIGATIPIEALVSLPFTAARWPYS